MSYTTTYSGYAPAYRSYSTFSPGRTYTTAYGHPAPVTTTSYVGSTGFYSPGRTYTTTVNPSYVAAPAPAYTTTSYGLGGSTVTYSPGYATRHVGLGNSYVSTSYY